MPKNTIQIILLTGLLGIFATILTGIGEFLLHYNPTSITTHGTFDFMISIPQRKMTIGHFIGVLAAPLYLFGYYHIYKMVEPAGEKLPKLLLFIAYFTFMIGITWLGSRALLGDIVKLVHNNAAPHSLIERYELYSENLIQIVRLGVVSISAIFMYLVLKGTTHYPKWAAIFSPIICMIAFIILYLFIKPVGGLFLPILLNAGHFVFFLMSYITARNTFNNG